MTAGEKMSRNPHALDTAGVRDITIVTVASLDRLQAQPKWEISGRSSFKTENDQELAGVECSEPPVFAALEAAFGRPLS